VAEPFNPKSFRTEFKDPGLPEELRYEASEDCVFMLAMAK
jgi:hypothetical protein